MSDTADNRRVDRLLKTETATIYALHSAADPAYFYVGSTIQPKTRLAHYRSGRKQHNDRLERRLDEIGQRNIRMATLETCPASQRFKREYDWIKKLRGEGAKLLNYQYNEAVPHWVTTTTWLTENVGVTSNRNTELRKLLEEIRRAPQLDLTPEPMRWLPETYLYAVTIAKRDCERFPQGMDPELIQRLNTTPSWPEDKLPPDISPERIGKGMDYLEKYGWIEYGPLTVIKEFPNGYQV